MITLTTEQAQQIEEALDELRYANNTDIAKTKYYKALSTIRAARAQADHIAGADKMVVPNGYALVSIDALKVWGKYDEVRNACQFPAEQAEQEPVDLSDALEAAFWEFDARRKGYGKWKHQPQSERDAFKGAAASVSAPVQQAKTTSGMNSFERQEFLYRQSQDFKKSQGGNGW